MSNLSQRFVLRFASLWNTFSVTETNKQNNSTLNPPRPHTHTPRLDFPQQTTFSSLANDNDGGKFGLSGQRRAEGITESRLPIPAPSGRLSALNTLSFELFSSGEEWVLGQRGLCGLVAQPQQALNWVAGLGRSCSRTSVCPCLTPLSPLWKWVMAEESILFFLSILHLDSGSFL